MGGYKTRSRRETGRVTLTSARLLYQILGVTRDASGADVRAAYLALVKKQHPDRGGDPATFADITQAYAVLSNPDRRAQYEAQLVLTTKCCPTCDGSGMRYKNWKKYPCEACDGTGVEV